MGTIPSRREDGGLTPLRLRAWISVSAAANVCRKYAASSGTPRAQRLFRIKDPQAEALRHSGALGTLGICRILPSFGFVPFAPDAANT